MAGIQESAATPAEPIAGFRRRIVLTTFGSLGDPHPYIAVALGLQARGHEAVIATSGYYRQKIEALGIGFRAVRPDHPDPEADPELMRRIMDRRTGGAFVIRELMMSVLRESYEDTLAATEGADFFHLRGPLLRTSHPWFLRRVESRHGTDFHQPVYGRAPAAANHVVRPPSSKTTNRPGTSFTCSTASRSAPGATRATPARPAAH